MHVAEALVPGFVEAVMRAGGKRPNGSTLRMVGSAVHLPGPQDHCMSKSPPVSGLSKAGSPDWTCWKWRPEALHQYGLPGIHGVRTWSPRHLPPAFHLPWLCTCTYVLSLGLQTPRLPAGHLGVLVLHVLLREANTGHM